MYQSILLQRKIINCFKLSVQGIHKVQKYKWYPFLLVVSLMALFNKNKRDIFVRVYRIWGTHRYKHYASDFHNPWFILYLVWGNLVVVVAVVFPHGKGRMTGTAQAGTSCQCGVWNPLGCPSFKESMPNLQPAGSMCLKINMNVAWYLCRYHHRIARSLYSPALGASCDTLIEGSSPHISVFSVTYTCIQSPQNCRWACLLT